MARNTTTATSYAARLAQSKEVKETAAQGRAVRQKAHELSNKIFELESAIERKNDDIEILKGSANLNISEVLAAQVRINELTAELEAANSLKSELFPA